MIYLRQMVDDFLTTNVLNEYDYWDENKNYIVEDTPSNDSACVYGNYVYRAVSEDNKGKIPPENIGTHWIKYGIVNSKAMIDLRSTTTTDVEGGDIVVTFKKGFINGIVVGNFSGNALIIENLDNDHNIMATPITFNQSPNNDVYDYFSYIYSDYTTRTDIATFHRLLDVGTKIRVTITPNSATGKASCGFLVAGEITPMGKTLSEVNFSFNSYSIKEVFQYNACVGSSPSYCQNRIVDISISIQRLCRF